MPRKQVCLVINQKHSVLTPRKTNVQQLQLAEGRSEQHDFFNRHLTHWVDTFCQDLVAIQSSPFYRAVDQLGLAFF